MHDRKLVQVHKLVFVQKQNLNKELGHFQILA